MTSSSKINEETPPTLHGVATLGLTSDGRWHVSYTGYYPSILGSKKALKFGSWIESSFNLNKLLKTMLPRFEAGRSLYLEKIHELEKAQKEAENVTTESNTDTSIASSSNSDSAGL